MKILIVDDHPLIREALGSVLATLDNEIEVIEVGDVNAALTLAGQYGDLGLILLDIYMPGMSGLDALDSFRTQFPEIPVVVMSGSENRADVMRAIDGGAMEIGRAHV